MKRYSSLVAVALVLALSGCGGGAQPEQPNAKTSTTTSVAAPPTESSDGDTGTNEDGYAGSGDIVEQGEALLDEMTDGDAGTATVTIGEETFEFAFFDDYPTATCDSDFFGGFLALLTTGPDFTAPNNQMRLTLPGGDFTDPPELEVTLKLDEEASWIADEGVYDRSPDLPPGIGVTSFTIDGPGASGTATFLNEESYNQFRAGTGDAVTAVGSFDITCSGS